MSSLVVLGIHYSGRKALSGYLSAVGLHALINLGPILSALKIIPAAISSLGIYAAILAAFVIFQNNMRAIGRMSGSAPVEKIYFEH
jgi:hypothetical protein